MVEHDREAMRSADWIIDLGPGGGAHGGRIVAEGTPEDLAAHTESLTGRYLRGSGEERALPARRPPAGWIELEGIRHHNLSDLNVSFPLGVFTAVTGVSGSGKSSLVMDVLGPAVEAGIQKSASRGRLRGARGLDAVRRLVVVDQQPIGRSPRSNPATYTGIWDHVRTLYAETKAAKVRGFDASRFSFNTGGGRCLACEGQGARQVEMHFLSDVWVPCEECGGKRYDRETLKILYKEKSIGDVLDLEVDEALELFENHPAIRRILETLSRVGLGYIKLGQASNTLSGGEAQRVKLAAELVTREGGGSFYILDEPTTGLHHEDVKKLIVVLQGLVEGGNTLVVIEHQLDVIRAADWVIDLGPEAGDEGGRLVAAGPPEEIAKSPESRTGRYLG
jgi:excinuclease ABC subunit A